MQENSKKLWMNAASDWRVKNYLQEAGGRGFLTLFYDFLRDPKVSKLRWGGGPPFEGR